MLLTSGARSNQKEWEFRMATNNHTTYFIYRIVCFITGQCYIGQTVNLAERKQRHLRELRRNDHHSPHLQQAFNKYGEQSFYFEALENNVQQKDVDRCEIEWIARFNSFFDGYNFTLGGQTGGSRTICIWNGITYPSMSTAAHVIGISTSAMGIRIRKGYSCDADVPLNFSQPCVWNCISYLSM